MSRRIQLSGGGSSTAYEQRDDGLLYREGSTIPVNDPQILNQAGVITGYDQQELNNYFTKLNKPVPTLNDFNSSVRGAPTFGPYQGPGSAFQQGVSTPETQWYNSYLSKAFTGQGGISPTDYLQRQAMGANYKPPETLTSDNLTSENDLSKGVTYSGTRQPYDTSKLDSTTGTATDYYALTPEERKQQDITDRLSKAYQERIGKTSFEAQQRQAQGVSDLERTQIEKSKKLKLLQAEAENIKTRPAGVGVTAGMLGAQQKEELRLNTIETLRVSAELDAANSEMSIAELKVKRAIAEKYGYLEERIAADEANLNLIKNSPTATQQEKKRADEQLAVRADAKKELDETKKDEEGAGKLALKYIENQAKNGLKIDQGVIDAIKNAKDSKTGKPSYFEAIKLAQRAGVYEKTEETTGSNIQSYLAEQGLPLTIATTKGELTTSALNKTVSAGVPLDVARHIWQNIKAGNDFETIRQGLLQDFGQDQGFKYLDAFVGALQGSSIQSGGNDTNKLDDLLNRL